MELIQKYFPDLSPEQTSRFAELPGLYAEINAKINLISRKDTENFTERHLLHSLALAKLIQFLPGTKVMDLGTGGGFPGIPLAVMFPETDFLMVDSIGKKVRAAESISEALGLKNTRFRHERAEKIEETFDFVVSRAVADIKDLYFWTRNSFNKKSLHETYANGIFALKGGDLKEEFADLKKYHRFFEIKNYFEEEFFETKRIVYVRV